jgi:murein DD-endopeptidase MepM/ murein hydrolase activator NlpD
MPPYPHPLVLQAKEIGGFYTTITIPRRENCHPLVEPTEPGYIRQVTATLRRGMLACALILACGCGGPATLRRPAPPSERVTTRTVHVVLPGETMWRIARRYGVTVEALAQYNGISDPRVVRAGRRLLIPPIGPLPDIDPASPSPALFGWPVTGPVASHFGLRDGRMHSGLDLTAPSGAEIRAARDGTVVYSGNGFSGYGNLVILDHGDGYVSLYAHNLRNLVREDDRVSRGDPIGLVGMTGNATAPHLHFEIRQEDRPVDPLALLPGEPSSVASSATAID